MKKKVKKQKRFNISPSSSDKEKAIQEILRNIQQAKKVKEKIKQVTKKKKIPKPKEKPKTQSPAKLDYQRAQLYAQQKQLDYGKLFAYLGNRQESPYQAYIKAQKEEKKSTELTEEQLERIIRREQTDCMLGKFLDQPFESIEEKEQFKYWKECNRFWNMVKIDMVGVGNNGAGKGVFYF